MVLQVIDGGSEIGVLQATSEEDCQSGGNRNLDILVGKLALCRSLVTGFFLQFLVVLARLVLFYECWFYVWPTMLAFLGYDI